jgi:outer membrane protein OmpA-like peptidoglycan-associated protein
MNKLSLLLLTSALVSLPVAAKAEWYVGGGGGVDIAHNYDIKTNVKQGVDLNTGWGALGSVGYKYGNGLRSELEFGYRDAQVNTVSSSAVDGGSERIYSLMANTLYDFSTGAGLNPYLGAGAGVAKVSFDNVRTIGASVLDNADTGFAVQGLAGVSVPVADALSFFAQYQYQHIFDVNANTNAGVEAKSDLGNSLITAGLRWDFGAPEMKPLVPVAAPAPVALVKEVVAAPAIEKYMVFFDFDRSDLTIEAADILKKVADNAKSGKVTRIELTGHADRAGKDGYNQKLSERRAETVKKQLIRLGLPTDEIETSAKGEREPLVATNDGVREPQNRRVEIVYGK